MAAYFTAVGEFIGVRPLEQVKDSFAKRPLAIKTNAPFNNILVVDLIKTESKDNTNLAQDFKPGEMVKISVDVVTRKTQSGNWFPSLTCYKIEKYIEQSTADFSEPKVIIREEVVDELPIPTSELETLAF